MYKPSLAIACMVRNPDPSIKTWIDYHRQQVDRIFFYLDEPEEGGAELLSGGAGVSVFPGAQAGNMLGANRKLERQDEIAARAVEQCRREGIDWLLHIDSDELIWTPEIRLRDYLAGVEADVGSVRFLNHEVVSRYADAGDCFKNFHLFKRNPGAFRLRGIVEDTDRFSWTCGDGKSAVRIAMAGKPEGVHLSRDKASRQHIEREDVALLHYFCPTYRHWFKEYAQLGDFSDFLRDEPEGRMFPGFHRESRDAYLLARQQLDWSIAEGFFQSRLLPEQDVLRLINTGAVFWADPFADLARLKTAAQRSGARAMLSSFSAPVAKSSTHPTVALVSTIGDLRAATRTWIDHHLRHVDRLFLYLDDPAQWNAEFETGDPRIAIFPSHRSRVFAGQKTLDTPDEADVSHALDACRNAGIDWLVHLDPDELLWCPANPLRNYLANMDQDVGAVWFLNHEVVSQFEDVDDCFKRLHLFKRNESRGEVDRTVRKCGAFFHAYAGGRSMVRVACADAPDRAHSFTLKSGRRHFEHSTVALLHYNCATYSLWLENYRRLGNFSDYWHDDRRLPIAEDFHLQSRDAFLRARRRLDWRIAEDFYRSQLLEPGEIHRLLNTGAVFWADPLSMPASTNWQQVGPMRQPGTDMRAATCVPREIRGVHVGNGHET